MSKIGRVCKNLLGREYGKKRKDFVSNVKMLANKNTKYRRSSKIISRHGRITTKQAISLR